MPTLVTGENNSQKPNLKENMSQTKTTDTVADSPLMSDNPAPSVRRDSDNPVVDTPPMPDSSAKATPTIINNKVPIVVFAGPAASGKSMILVRLAKYLHSNGYTVKTDPTFLNTSDYQEHCQKFNDALATTTALDGTVKFLLVNVYKDGREIAKLLEAPGEDFYTIDAEKIKIGANNSVEPYLAAIMTSNNPKSYVVLLDLDSEVSFRNNGYHRESYERRFLNNFYPAINKKRDRIILLYNKIDKTMFGNINGCDDISGARADAELYYKGLFSTMKVKKFGGFITVDNFTFKTFCTGMFAKQRDSFGKTYQTYNIASDVYPQELWKEIIKKW